MRSAPFRAGMPAALAVLLLAACGDQPPPPYQGYVEGESLLMAAPQAGTLDRLHVRRGQALAASAPLFELEHSREDAALREAAERMRAAEARARNLAEPRRQRELQALQAQVAQAGAARVLAQQELARAEDLAPQGALPRAELDSARQRLQQQLAREAELQAQLDLARQSIGRSAEQAAAAAEVEAARAVLKQAEWQLAQRSVAAPAAGVVQDTFYNAGELVAAGRPVLSLLPPQNVKLRFFVPAPQLGALKLGAAARVSCDGCGAPIAARISFIAAQAEYTPPVLYSAGARSKLVFMVEARPEAAADAQRLHPGQPVDVVLQ